MKKNLWRLAGFLAAGFLIWTDITHNPFGERVLLILVLIGLAPFAVVFFFQICIWVYQWIVFGNPFWERSDNVHIKIISDTEATPRVKKLCPICMRLTHCKVKKSRIGFWVHVQKG